MPVAKHKKYYNVSVCARLVGPVHINSGCNSRLPKTNLRRGDTSKIAVIFQSALCL